MKDELPLYIPIEKQMKKREAFWNQWGGEIYKWDKMMFQNEHNTKYEKGKIKREMKIAGNDGNILPWTIVQCSNN